MRLGDDGRLGDLLRPCPWNGSRAGTTVWMLSLDDGDAGVDGNAEDDDDDEEKAEEEEKEEEAEEEARIPTVDE